MRKYRSILSRDIKKLLFFVAISTLFFLNFSNISIGKVSKIDEIGSFKNTSIDKINGALDKKYIEPFVKKEITYLSDDNEN